MVSRKRSCPCTFSEAASSNRSAAAAPDWSGFQEKPSTAETINRRPAYPERRERTTREREPRLNGRSGRCKRLLSMCERRDEHDDRDTQAGRAAHSSSHPYSCFRWSEHSQSHWPPTAQTYLGEAASSRPRKRQSEVITPAGRIVSAGKDSLGDGVARGQKRGGCSFTRVALPCSLE